MNKEIKQQLKDKKLKKLVVFTRISQDISQNSSGGDYDEWSEIIFKNGRFYIYHDGSSCSWHDRCQVCGEYDCTAHQNDDYLCEYSEEEVEEFLENNSDQIEVIGETKKQ